MDLHNVLAHYLPSRGVQSVTAWSGGFSGANVWRLRLAGDDLCLRAWPERGVSRERLRWVHGAIYHLATKRIAVAPVPLRTISGESFVCRQDRFWELTPWMPGRADYRETPGPEKLSAAMTTLAEIHGALADYPHLGHAHGVSPGLAARLERCHRLQCGEADRLASTIDNLQGLEVAACARRLVSGFHRLAPQVVPLLEEAAGLQVPLQTVLADIWHGHVLFTGQRVTGVVDLGSMRLDSVSADLARLLGSMVGNDPLPWQQGLDAYQRVNQLSPEEVLLTTAFDRSTVLMAGMNWIDWVFAQRRPFANRQAVLERMQEIERRLYSIQ